MDAFPLDELNWAAGLTPPDYFAGLANYRNLVLSLYEESSVADEDRRQVAAALGTLTGDNRWTRASGPPPEGVAPGEAVTVEPPADRLRLVILTEDWCGDSATTLPYIARLAEVLDLPARVFRQSANPALKAWYVDHGTEHIPVVSLLKWSNLDETVGEPVPFHDAPSPTNPANGTWTEVMRWVERPAAAHERVEAWLAEQPRFTELYARKDEDTAAAKEYFSLYARLLRTMAGWYRGGLWPEIATEFAEKIGENAGLK
jgi:hypothetical protein